MATATNYPGRLVNIKDSGGEANTNNISIAGENGETIDGSATLVLDGDYDSVTLVGTGADWGII